MASDQLNAPSGEKNAVSAGGHHHPALLALLAEELSVAPEHIADLELSLYDTQLSCLGDEILILMSSNSLVCHRWGCKRIYLLSTIR